MRDSHFTNPPLVGKVGVEPTRLSTQSSEPCAAAITPLAYKIWSTRRESNPRITALQAAPLPFWHVCVSLFGTVGGTRTHTPFGTTPSRWRDCQFLHDGNTLFGRPCRNRTHNERFGGFHVTITPTTFVHGGESRT